MKAEHADLIAKAAYDVGRELTRHSGYSGRGMFGKATDGVSGSLVDIVYAVAFAAHTEGCLVSDLGDEFVAAMGRLHFDNMGLDWIIY